jgi:hypothetical protein
LIALPDLNKIASYAYKQQTDYPGPQVRLPSSLFLFIPPPSLLFSIFINVSLQSSLYHYPACISCPHILAFVLLFPLPPHTLRNIHSHSHFYYGCASIPYPLCFTIGFPAQRSASSLLVARSTLLLAHLLHHLPPPPAVLDCFLLDQSYDERNLHYESIMFFKITPLPVFRLGILYPCILSRPELTLKTAGTVASKPLAFLFFAIRNARP